MKLAIVGPGEAGKDVVGEMLRDMSNLRYVAGTSKFAAGIVFDKWGRDFGYSSVDDCWVNRRFHRTTWAHHIGEYNRHDPVALYRHCLIDQDMLTGIRWDHERQAIVNAGLVDLWIWVKRDVPPDPTMEFGEGVCDISIDNNGTLFDLRRKLVALAKTWGILK